MRSKLILLLACITCLHVNAQKTSKYAYQSFNHFGLIKGESETSLVLQSVNGVRFKSWFLGAGVGLDEYYFSSLPLFLDIKKTLPQKLKSVFVYADGGWNVSLEKDIKNDYAYRNSRGGLYYDVGFGWNKPLQKKLCFVASAGYTQKNMKRDESAFTMYLNEIQPQFETKHSYDLKRLSFKVGLAF